MKRNIILVLYTNYNEKILNCIYITHRKGVARYNNSNCKVSKNNNNYNAHINNI